MGYTMSEKILARASGKEYVHAGDIVWVNVDRAMMDDILGPRVEIAENITFWCNWYMSSSYLIMHFFIETWMSFCNVCKFRTIMFIHINHHSQLCLYMFEQYIKFSIIHPCIHELSQSTGLELIHQ